MTSLPEEVVNKIKLGDSEVAEWSINQAICRAHKCRAVRETLEQVNAWRRQIPFQVKYKITLNADDLSLIEIIEQ